MTTWVSRYQKGKSSLDINQARDDGVLGCSGHQLDHSKQSAPRSRQITTQTPHQSIFYRQDALPDAQQTVSEHWKDVHIVETAARKRTKTRLINMQPKNTTLLCRGNNYASRESPTCRVVGETTSWDAGLNGGAEYFSWEWIGCTGNAAGRLYVGREYGCPDNGWYVPCQPQHTVLLKLLLVLIIIIIIIIIA